MLAPCRTVRAASPEALVWLTYNNEVSMRESTALSPSEHTAQNEVSDDNREEILALQMKIAYLEKHCEELNDALIAQQKRMDQQEENQKALHKVLESLLQRFSSLPQNSVAGQYDVDDPVPRAG